MRSEADPAGGRGPAHRIRLWVLPAVALVITLGAVAWFTPALAVRQIRIEGAGSVGEERVREVLGIPEGVSMLRLDPGDLAARVASIPTVRSARVSRVYPSTIRVRVEQRTPALYYETPAGAHLLDADAVEYQIGPAPIGVPKLETERPGAADERTRAALDVVTALPPALEIQVETVHARSVSDISLTLRDGRRVLWGGSEDGERKAAVVLPALTRPGTVFDVSSPSLVAVK